MDPRTITSLALGCYGLATILIGFFARGKSRSLNAYLNANRALPTWIVVIAYVAANCGALEVLGLSAMAAEYGFQTFHLYLIGAIPAMIFVALWLMPLYRRNNLVSVPEYLQHRFGSSVRTLNALAVSLSLLLLGGINLYAIGQVVEVGTGLAFGKVVTVASVTVLIYVLLGGIRSNIYNELALLVLLVGALLPISIKGIAIVDWHSRAGGYTTHLWRTLPAFTM